MVFVHHKPECMEVSFNVSYFREQISFDSKTDSLIVVRVCGRKVRRVVFMLHELLDVIICFAFSLTELLYVPCHVLLTGNILVCAEFMNSERTSSAAKSFIEI